MNYKLLSIMLFALGFSTAYAGGIVPPTQNPSLFTSSYVFSEWIPIIVIAATLTVMLAAVYYMIGYILNNQRIKGSAVLELQQAFGSIILVVIILAVFTAVGSAQLGFSNLLGTNGVSDVQQMCSTYLNYGASGQQPIDFLSSNYIDPNTNLPEPTTAICGSIINPSGAVDSDTASIDYGLAATYVIIANMTNQTIGNLNSLYNFDSVIFFLRNLNPFIIICAPVECINPLEQRSGIKFSYTPYVGYVFHRTIMPTMATEANLTIYLFTMQLFLILLLLVGWPYMLAAGIILRTIPFTRRIGGLLVALALIGVIILPTIFLFEYSTLNNLGASGTTIIGLSSTQIPALSLCGYGPIPSGQNSAGSGTTSVLYCYTDSPQLRTSYVFKNLPNSAKSQTLDSCLITQAEVQDGGGDPLGLTDPCYVQRTLSFYTFPKIDQIVGLYSCYPTNILAFEGEILGATLLNTATLPLTTILSFFNSGINNQNAASGISETGEGFLLNLADKNLLANTCLTKTGPYYIVAALNTLTNVYGILAVSGFLIPIINLLILLSAVTGLSALMGGETVIVGLSRFI